MQAIHIRTVHYDFRFGNRLFRLTATKSTASAGVLVFRRKPGESGGRMKATDTSAPRRPAGQRTPRKAAAKAAPRERARKRRPSGPSTPGRREEVVREAAVLFLERGYEEVSIDDIVARIGGSKGTIYAWFGGKAGLFEVVIREFCSRTTRDLAIEFDQSLSIAEQLGGFSSAFLSLILSPQSLSLHRLVVSNKALFPELAKIFYESGPESAYGILGAWITEQQAAGRLRDGNARQMAILHLDMLTGHHQLAALLGIPAESTAAKVNKTVESAVRLFLECYATR
jgi:AcrR family transcriptional regulator